eukprot:Gb_03404 [translate_table: standard]
MNSLILFLLNNGSLEMEVCTVGVTGMEVLTPRTHVIPKPTQQTAKKGSSVSSKDSSTNPAGSQLAKQTNSGARGNTVVKNTKQAISRCIRNIALKKENSAEKNPTQENQAVKRQKLEAGRLRQILNIKERILPHKVQPNMSILKDLTTAMEKNKERQWNSASKMAKLASPFISVAEKVRRFQSKTPERFSNRPISHDGSVVSLPQKPNKLTLTQPKEPELGTAQRARPIRVKSTAELEEEMLAKIPKFKARPLNKKILEAPSLPLPQKSAPHLPEFQEFHLKTMERALQHSGAASVMSSSTDSAVIPEKQTTTGCVLTEPKPPHLETALRARPPKVKSSEELEQEELEKMPKFKARPLNKKIFCSRGDLGIFCNLKRQITTPVEFHFATDDRLHVPPPTELFKKLSLNTEPQHDPIPRLTVPQPFHLITEDRGAEKERKFVTELLEHERREQEARIPKANPYPYTTDYPVVPPKPNPKECTKPEPFQLESLVRHEEELQCMEEEQARIKREEAEMRKFRAQPVISKDYGKYSVPVPVPERSRMPLTEVYEFTFHADARAIERAEFDKKVKEKENLYKRFREEYETAKMMEEERAIKMMRKTMIPHARPVPVFNRPFVPQRSTKELTKPKSPKLRVLNRKERRRSVSLSAQKRFQMR